jgi:hypothetical protein
MPARGHSQQQAHGERLAGNNRGCVGQKFRLNELFSLVGLRKAVWGNSNNQPAKQPSSRMSQRQFHGNI